ncbi:hypothetical protein [Listeria booriae]|uniref:Amidase domain-containing protein n=1 Tax=Listeria booriae TaxID=1552123 RepID=A0A841YKH9_9LIST|nr:hypothetical protein [Listeria booriae]MBC1400498.1 hypothetical protein [Listeria booriae]MBC1615776.1 hypothetical protein [Listeria booriae]MBC2319321.1 hypothetical protein [Listeria booriae]
MKKWIVVVAAYFAIVVCMLVAPLNVNAKGEANYQKIYEQGVSEGKINTANVSLEQWIDVNENEYYPVYEDGLKEKVYDISTTYAEWIKMNNYGQPPVADEFVEEVPQSLLKGVYKGYTVKKGDILISNGTSSAGVLGHAAIANGNDYILDIPGPGTTTRQLTTVKWMTIYDSKGWVKVYRVKDSSIANAAANWADRNYYSSTGTKKQDKWPSYNVTGSRYSKDPTYCSKIVIQAFYFGTGSKPVIRVFPSLALPYDLPSYFNGAYSPQFVKGFN